MHDVSLEDLVRRCTEGDAVAWNELVQRHRALVWSVPLRLGLDAAEAAEVFQDTFESLLRNLGSLSEPGRTASWLYTAARRLSMRRISVKRRAERREEREEQVLDRVQDHNPDINELLDREQRGSLVLQLLESLPERCRSLLTALFLDPDEPDYDQVATRTGIPRGAIGPTRSRCLKKLHEELRLRENPAK